MSLLRRYWAVLALLAGAALMVFEYKRAGGVSADNVFWIFVGAMVMVLAAVDLIQRLRGGETVDLEKKKTQRKGLPPLGPLE